MLWLIPFVELKKWKSKLFKWIKAFLENSWTNSNKLKEKKYANKW